MTPSTDDFRRVVGLACDQEARTDEEHDALARVAAWVEDRLRNEGTNTNLVSLVRCTREVELKEAG